MLSSSRRGIVYPNTNRSDTADVPRDIAALVAALEVDVIYGQGTLAARPTSTAGSPGIQGRLYMATDQTPHALYYDYGTGWDPVGSLSAGSVGTTQLADGSVTTIKVADANVTLAKMATDSVDASKIVDGSITAAELAAALKPSGGAGAATEALRALGTGAGNAAAGNDARLSDQRVPTDGSVTAAKLAPETIQAAKGANYTLALADRLTMIPVNAAVTITLPKDTTAAFAVGDSVDFLQTGAGQITFAAEAGATVQSFGNLLKSAGQYALVSAIKTAANTWTLAGNLTT